MKIREQIGDTGVWLSLDVPWWRLRTRRSVRKRLRHIAGRIDARPHLRGFLVDYLISTGAGIKKAVFDSCPTLEYADEGA